MPVCGAGTVRCMGFGEPGLACHCYFGTLSLGGVDGPLPGGYVRWEGHAVCWRFPRDEIVEAPALLGYIRIYASPDSALFSDQAQAGSLSQFLIPAC